MEEIPYLVPLPLSVVALVGHTIVLQHQEDPAVEALAKEVSARPADPLGLKDFQAETAAEAAINLPVEVEVARVQMAHRVSALRLAQAEPGKPIRGQDHLGT